MKPLCAVLLSLAVALVVIGCDRSMPIADAGSDAAPDARSDSSADAGDPGPTVIATSPVDGAVRVPVDTTLAVAFSEAMEGTTGTLALADGDGALPRRARVEHRPRVAGRLP
jgi:hypothetical protein